MGILPVVPILLARLARLGRACLLPTDPSPYSRTSSLQASLVLISGRIYERPTGGEAAKVARIG